MLLRISPSMRSITISSSNEPLGPMKLKPAANLHPPVPDLLPRRPRPPLRLHPHRRRQARGRQRLILLQLFRQTTGSKISEWGDDNSMNLRSNFTLWKLGVLQPALIAFRGNVQPIDPCWHMLGVGYQEKTDFDSVRKSAVIHYNGHCKSWLEIGYEKLQPFWAKHVNYSNEFVRNCHIFEPQL